MRRVPHRDAFTLIEMIVALGILCLLIALFLPAVQGSREAARRSTCQNHLYQIGLALHHYVSSNGSFPPSLLGYYNDGNRPIYDGFHSIHARLLPFLDQRPLYDSINFSVGTYPPETFTWGPLKPHEVVLNTLNSTVFRSDIPVFLCPSDPSTLGAARNNYRGNTGIGPFSDVSAESPDSGNGLFPKMVLTNPALVTDGMSHTAALAERTTGSGRDDDPDPQRDLFGLFTFIRTGDDLLLACGIAARKGNSGFGAGGRWWFWTGLERTLYNHAQAPNGHRPDCIMGGCRTGPGMATARSFHPGGVNLLMADGSCRFVHASIALPVWRGIGTRNGGELVD